MLKNRLLFLIIISFFIACSSDKQSSDAEKNSLELNIFNSKYIMSIGKQNWESLKFKKLNNTKNAVIFTSIGLNQNNDCILEGEIHKKKDFFIFTQKNDDLELIFKKDNNDIIVSSDNEKNLIQTCGKNHLKITGKYTLIQ